MKRRQMTYLLDGNAFGAVHFRRGYTGPTDLHFWEYFQEGANWRGEMPFRRRELSPSLACGIMGVEVKDANSDKGI